MEPAGHPGAQRRHRLAAQAEERPAGRYPPGPQTGREPPGAAAPGLVPAVADSPPAHADSPALLAGGVARASQKSGAGPAANARPASSGQRSLRGGGTQMGGPTILAYSAAGVGGTTSAPDRSARPGDRAERKAPAGGGSLLPEIALLDTLPGVGPLLAAVIWGEVGDLQRSPSAEALVNYTGLIPSLYQSGEVKVQGHIHPPGF